VSGVAGRHPECVRAVVGLNTWAWPGASAPHFVRFSNFMGGSVGGFSIRRARTIALSGAGHCVQEESPTELAAAIRGWWPAEVEAEE
jgi:hypothetical protein